MAGRIKISCSRATTKGPLQCTKPEKLPKLPELAARTPEVCVEELLERNLTLLEMCKIAVWMDQFQCEDIVQTKFIKTFSSNPPSREKILEIHLRFLQTGSVLETRDSSSTAEYIDCFDIKKEPDVILLSGTKESVNDIQETNSNNDQVPLFVNRKSEVISSTDEEEEDLDVILSERNDVLYPEMVLHENDSSGLKGPNSEIEHSSHKRDFFRCSSCSFTVNNTAAYRAHVKLCSRGAKMNNWNISMELTDSSCCLCTECGKAFASENALKTHITYHSKLRPYACSHCTYRFKTETALTKHILTHDKLNTLECPHCTFTCSFKSKLAVHIRAHSGEKPFHCRECDYKATSIINLKRHATIHNKSNAYKCTECNFSTHQMSFLKGHLLTHSKENNYTCQLCDEKFKTPSSLRYHISRCHMSQKFHECPFCDFRHLNLPAMKMHIRIHTGEKPYTCSLCHFKSLRSKHLKHHIATAH